MSVNRYWMPVIVIVALLGSVVVAQAFGWWTTSGRGTVRAGQLLSDDLKGWMSLEQVADGVGISLEELYQLGGFPADTDPTTALKDMEGLIEVSTLRQVLADYLENSPSTAPESAPEAAPTLEPTPAPTPEPAQESPAEVEEVPLTGSGTGSGSGNGSGSGSGAGYTALQPGEVLAADEIRGRMTLREVSQLCGVDLDQLLVLLDLPPDVNLDTSLKSLTDAGTLDEVSHVKDAVASLQ